MRATLIAIAALTIGCASATKTPSEPKVTAEDLCGPSCSAQDIVDCIESVGPCECPDPCRPRGILR